MSEELLCCFYLHTNGDLICKNAAVFMGTTPAEYFDSSFVVRWWAIPKKSPTGEMESDVKWTMDWLREAYELSSDKERTKARIFEICKTNGWPDMIANAVIEGKKASVLRASDPCDPDHTGPTIGIQVEEGENPDEK